MKIKKIFISCWPIFFIFLVWLIFATPYYLKNKVPYASSYQVNSVPPWSYYEKFWGPVKNSAMPDIIGQLYPWRYFSINLWKNGEIPFWNPYSFSGNPHLANYQSAVFSPFNLLFFILPFVDSWRILVLLQPLLAGIFTYFLMKEFKISSVGSAISAITFMFSGFIVVWMAYGTMSMAIAFLPLSLLSLEKNFRKLSPIWLLILSLSLPLSFFSGHFQTSLYCLTYIILFFIFKAIQIKDKKKIIFILLSIIFGIVISLIQILPSIEFYLYSARSSIFIKNGTGIPFYYLITMLAPDFFGNPVTRNDWFGYYAEWSSFVGVIPLTLSLFAINKKKTLSIFFVISGILFLLLAIESPIIQLISILKIPVLSTSNPTRIIILFSFSFAVLAGFGLDNLKELMLRGKTKKILSLLAGVGITLFFIWALLLIFKILPADKLLIAKRNLILPTILFGGVFMATIVSLKFKRLMLFTICCLLFAVSYDSYRFAQKWMPFDSKDLVFANIPIIDAMKKNIGNGRYFGNLGDQVDSYYGFSSIEGYDPLYIERYGEFIQSALNGKYMPAQRSVVKLGRRNKYVNRVLDLLGVSLIFHPISDTNKGWAYPVWDDIKRNSLIYKDDKFQLFKNNMAMPRAVLFYDYEIIKDKKSIIRRFYSDDFDFRNKLILEKDPHLQSKMSAKGKADFILYSPNKIIINTKTQAPAILFLSDNFYPGWEVWVNSEKTEILRADYTFRSVVVPKGDSKVEFKYSPSFLLMFPKI